MTYFKLKDDIVFGKIFFYLLKLILDCDKLKKVCKIIFNFLVSLYIFLFP